MGIAHKAPGAAAAVALVVLVLFMAGPASAQVIHGRVVEDATSQPLDLVSIELLDEAGEGRASVVSDSVGAFRVRAPEPGSFWLRLTRIGYADVVTSSVEVAVGEQVELELRMSPTAVPLEPLRVVGRVEYLPGRLREYFDRATVSRRMGRGRIFMRDDLDRRPFPQPSAILAQMPPRDGCWPTILLDGLPVGSPRELDAMVYTDALEGVELYAGATQIPQQYANRGYCAVALFWTRHDVEHARPLTWRRLFLAVALITGGFLIMR